jgi:hypothetical protein
MTTIARSNVPRTVTRYCVLDDRRRAHCQVDSGAPSLDGVASGRSESRGRDGMSPRRRQEASGSNALLTAGANPPGEQVHDATCGGERRSTTASRPSVNERLDQTESKRIEADRTALGGIGSATGESSLVPSRIVSDRNDYLPDEPRLVMTEGRGFESHAPATDSLRNSFLSAPRDRTSFYLMGVPLFDLV